jgi:hypothetical protein
MQARTPHTAAAALAMACRVLLVLWRLGQQYLLDLVLVCGDLQQGSLAVLRLAVPCSK